MPKKENILKIDTTTPLRIELEEKSKESTRPTERLAEALRFLWPDTLFRVVLIGFFIVAIATIVLVWLIYFPHTYGLKHSAVGIDYSVEYCPRLTVGDENSVKVTFGNANNNPITNVIAYLTFSDTLPIGTTTDGSNAVSFEDLAPGERKTRIIKVMLPIRTSSRTEGKLQIEAHQIPKTELVALPFSIPIIPYLKTLVTSVLGFIALALTSAFTRLVSGAMKGILPPD